MSRESILNEISIERDREDDELASTETFLGVTSQKSALWELMSVLGQQTGAAFKAFNGAASFEQQSFNLFGIRDLRKELLQVAAAAVHIVEQIDQGIATGARGVPASSEISVEHLPGYVRAVGAPGSKP